MVPILSWRRPMTLPLLSLVFGAPDDPAGGGSRDRERCGSEVTKGHVARDLAAGDPDRPLLERLRVGDTSAVDAFVALYYEKLVAFAAHITGDVASAEDVVQDTLVATWERRDGLVVRTTVAAYLFTAVRNTALNAQRSRRNRARWTEAHVADAISGGEAPGIDAVLEQEEQERALRAALELLPQRYREVLTLRVTGLTYEAIAEVLAVPVKTARTRGLRGIGMLRAALEEWG
jgi:RNA polymerase sigma factor (sigma-70 family)